MGKRIPAQKADQLFLDRVSAVGASHFGIVAVDVAKSRSKWMLTNFLGKVLVEATEVRHDRAALSEAITAVRNAQRKHSLKALVVAVERTGRYHRRFMEAFRSADFDVRVVHPFATQRLRQPAAPGNKTDARFGREGPKPRAAGSGAGW